MNLLVTISRTQRETHTASTKISGSGFPSNSNHQKDPRTSSLFIQHFVFWIVLTGEVDSRYLIQKKNIAGDWCCTKAQISILFTGSWIHCFYIYLDYLVRDNCESKYSPACRMTNPGVLWKVWFSRLPSGNWDTALNQIRPVLCTTALCRVWMIKRRPACQVPGQMCPVKIKRESGLLAKSSTPRGAVWLLPWVHQELSAITLSASCEQWSKECIPGALNKWIKIKTKTEGSMRGQC